MLGAWVALTLALTFPLVLELPRGVADLGDPLLNSWILAWETHALFGDEPRGFFDANIFFPYANTLAYSELLIPQLVVAAPLILASGNPVLAHNVVLLASIFATALAMYALAHSLTRSVSASMVAGLVFAFCPFMFSHLSHVQIFFAAGIPLAFLFVDRFFAARRTSDLTLAALSFSAQALANTYFGVYLGLFLGLYLTIASVRHGAWKERRFWWQMSLFAGIVLVCLLPLYSHYFQLRREMGFTRLPYPGAELEHFVVSPAFNRVWGPLTGQHAQPEYQLLPGLVAMLLAAIGLAERRHGARALGASRSGRLRALDALLLLGVGLVFAILLSGGFEILGGRVTAHTLRNPILVCLALGCTRVWLARRQGVAVVPPWAWLERPLYPTILCLAFLASLGTGFYRLLWEWVPGFSALRASPRIHVFTMFALAVMAAEGTAWLVRRSKGRTRWLLRIGLPALVGLEFLSVPLPLTTVPESALAAPIHRWLAEQPRPTSFVVYPLHGSEYDRVYGSTAHFQPMVNGSSGFTPPVLHELRQRGVRVPSLDTLRELREIGVDLVLIDTALYLSPRDARRPLRRMQRNAGAPVAVVGDTHVFDLRRPSLTPGSARAPAPLARCGPHAVDLDRSGWILQSSTWNAEAATDGLTATVWQADMSPGEHLAVDLGARFEVCSLRIAMAGHAMNYPRGYRVSTSLDGEAWEEVSANEVYSPTLEELSRPAEMVLELAFAPHAARHIRITQTASSSDWLWVIPELEIRAGGS